MIERIRENIARKLVWWAKVIEPGFGRMMDARQGWYVNFEWGQPVSKYDTADVGRTGENMSRRYKGDE